ncbi:hypothetical protein VNI00_018602 [Paramarasmius palmivorus]|uniref:Uncharacterized protein n=1 Tax=Paramarasmius palmivorus TaxID=297713 RepID=A0AAW0AVL8_9AGAR
MQRGLRKRKEPAPSTNSSERDPQSTPLPSSDLGSTVDGTYNDKTQRRGPLPKSPRKNRSPNKKVSLTKLEKDRVVEASLRGKRCGVTGESFKGNADNEFCHVAEKSTPIELIHHLELGSGPAVLQKGNEVKAEEVRRTAGTKLLRWKSLFPALRSFPSPEMSRNPFVATLRVRIPKITARFVVVYARKEFDITLQSNE